MNLFCRELSHRIDVAYNASGNDKEWRLLASPPVVLDKADVAFIGLNPGGNKIPGDHPKLAPTSGSAYVEEVWGNFAPGMSPLQRQVRLLFRKLSVRPEDVLAGNLVPFRSRDWSHLQNVEFSLNFGTALWTELLQRARPTIIVGMGNVVFEALHRSLDCSDMEKFQVGWGKIAGRRATCSLGTLIGLPHLSRFGIVTRAKSQPGLAALFGDRWSAQEFFS